MMRPLAKVWGPPSSSETHVGIQHPTVRSGAVTLVLRQTGPEDHYVHLLRACKLPSSPRAPMKLPVLCYATGRAMRVGCDLRAAGGRCVSSVHGRGPLPALVRPLRPLVSQCSRIGEYFKFSKPPEQCDILLC